jgi:transitional endoplasmic reticulum ATPase
MKLFAMLYYNASQIFLQVIRSRFPFDNLEKAIRLTKPSAIKYVTVEIPQVHWSSIGGMDQVKRELREAIELPLTHGHIFQQL